MSEQISAELAKRRFGLDRGRCECCRKELYPKNRGRCGARAWEAHHRFPWRSVTLDNIRVVCTNGLNCHLNHCHRGDYYEDPVWRPCWRRR